MDTQNTLQQLIGFGGKEWVKGEMHRVYFERDTFLEFAKSNDLVWNTVSGEMSEIRRMNSNKTWFDVKTNSFSSTKVSIQYYFDSYINNQERLQ